jgi:hypothetical protein
MVRIGLWSLVGAAVIGCAPGDDDAGGTFRAEACVGASGCDDPGDGGGGDGGGDPGACFEVAELTYDLYTVGGISMCEPFEPGRCGVAQQGCTVTIECESYPAITATIDERGVTTVQQVPLGDGIIADCHAEFDDFGMDLLCDAMGVSCEYSARW